MSAKRRAPLRANRRLPLRVNQLPQRIRLAAAIEALPERDRLVLMACAGAGIPVAIVLAGGYPRSLDTLVEIHCATFDEAKTLSAFA